MLPRWEVDLGQSPAAVTWDETWQIKIRYKRDVLDQEYFNWLEHFAQWCRIEERYPVTHGEIIDALETYVAAVFQEGLADRAFLKRAVFEMLKSHVTAGPYSDRLTAFLIDLASPDTGAAA
jgi:hypothetical protein